MVVSDTLITLRFTRPRDDANVPAGLIQRDEVTRVAQGSVIVYPNGDEWIVEYSDVFGHFEDELEAGA